MEMASEPAPRLILRPGDLLDIRFYYAPELNDTQTVLPDGKITLQLIGEVQAEGKTPAELRAELVNFYAAQLKRPEVAVIVRSWADRRVYVGGDVLKPGLIYIPRPTTALEAIMEAGGFDYRRAEVSNVVIIRHKDGKRYGCSLDFRAALAGKEFQDFYLEPRDIVYVPRTKISQVNLWIDQHINQMIPRVGLSFSKDIGGGATIGFIPITTVVTQP
jgi:protein involved in polysaccharide export with SLBB domain